MMIHHPVTGHEWDTVDESQAEVFCQMAGWVIGPKPPVLSSKKAANEKETVNG